MKKIGAIIGGLVALVAGIVGGSQVMGLASTEFRYFAGDVVGTKSATTTTGVGFRVGATGGQSATSSYVVKIGGNRGLAIFTFKVTNASSSANLKWDFQGSNDDFCDTSTSTTIYDQVTTNQIAWFSAGDNSKEKAQTTAFDNASSTVGFVWNNPDTVAGQSVVLHDLAWECLRLNISGSSTVAHVQVRAR